MDLISTLTLFATILGIGALVGAALSFLFAHEHSDPLRRQKRSAIDDFLRYVCSDAFKQDLLVGNGFLRIADLQPQVFTARKSTVEQRMHECEPSDIPTP